MCCKKPSQPYNLKYFHCYENQEKYSDDSQNQYFFDHFSFIFLSSHLCFSGSIQGTDFYMESPELRYHYELFVNFRILQF